MVDFILNFVIVKLGNEMRLICFYNELLNKDWFMILIDFDVYIKVKE